MWVKGSPKGPLVRGHALPPGRALHSCGRLVALRTPSLLGVFWSKKNHREGFIPFGHRLVFLFCEKQGNTETGTRL